MKKNRYTAFMKNGSVVEVSAESHEEAFFVVAKTHGYKIDYQNQDSIDRLVSEFSKEVKDIQLTR